MITVRRAAERGHADHGWLDTWHTFSFDSYRDPDHVRFRALRVMNEDRIAPGRGFGTHPHHDMEIVTYVLDGELEHRDSMGHGERLRAGEFQRMTAGTGITHSEFNPSPDRPLHLYQIWLFPERKGLEPSYEQKRFAPDERRGRWQLVASPRGTDGALRIHQDVEILLADLRAGETLGRDLAPGRHGWLQVLRGAVAIGGRRADGSAPAKIDLKTSDGAATSDVARVELHAKSDAELMWFDLA